MIIEQSIRTLVRIRFLGHDEDFRSLNRTGDHRLHQGYWKASCEFQPDFMTIRRILLIKLRQTHDQGVLVWISHKQSRHIWKCSSVKAPDTFGLINVPHNTKLVLEMWLSLPLDFHCVYRVLDGKPSHNSRHAHQWTSEKELVPFGNVRLEWHSKLLFSHNFQIIIRKLLKMH